MMTKSGTTALSHFTIGTGGGWSAIGANGPSLRSTQIDRRRATSAMGVTESAGSRVSGNNSTANIEEEKSRMVQSDEIRGGGGVRGGAVWGGGGVGGERRRRDLEVPEVAGTIRRLQKGEDTHRARGV